LIHSALVLTVGLTAMCPAQAQQAPPAPPLRTLKIAVGEHYAVDSASEPLVRRDLELLKQLGITRLRFAMAWDEIEPANDQYDWRLPDLVTQVAGDLGIELMAYVCYTPAWSAAAGDGDAFARPPADPQDFERFMHDAAARYRGRIVAWEIWNEPDNPAFWDGTFQQYGELLKAGSRGVRGGAPDAVVVSGGLWWDTDWLTELLRSDAEVGRSINAIGLHCSVQAQSPERIEQMHGYIRSAKDAAQRFAQGQPLWLTEIGYSSLRPGGVDAAPAYRHEHTARYQAAALVKMFSECAASEGVELACWPRIRDQRDGTPPLGIDPNLRHMGLVGPDHQPKPAREGMATAVSLLGQPYRVMDGQIQLTAPLNSDAHLHALEHESGDLAVVGWLRSPAPPTAADAADDRRERVSLVVPGQRPQAARVTTATGADAGEREVRLSGEQSSVRRVPLGADGVTVLRLGAAATRPIAEAP
jgi:hypothetical protein